MDVAWRIAAFKNIVASISLIEHCRIYIVIYLVCMGLSVIYFGSFVRGFSSSLSG